MWSDNSHGQGWSAGQAGGYGKMFSNGHKFHHSPALDRLCLHSRLGCVLAGGDTDRPQVSFLRQVQEAAQTNPASQVSAEAAAFVAVIVVFYAAIIVILLGTNMRRPRSSASSAATASSRSRARSRSRSRHRHQVTVNPRSGQVKTQHTPKKKGTRHDASWPGAESV